MNKKYRRLCAEHRIVIYQLNKASFTQAEIGKPILFEEQAEVAFYSQFTNARAEWESF